MSMQIEIRPAESAEIEPLREQYRREMDCQIVRDSYHRRGFADPYILLAAGDVAGYAAVTNGSHRAVPAGSLFEAWLRPDRRGLAVPIFHHLLQTTGVSRIEAQSNDVFLTLMLYDFAADISSDTILFHDALNTSLSIAGADFRRAADTDSAGLFEHASEPPGDWVLEVDGRIVATGGFLTHYNPPYADIYMEVSPIDRRRGYGSYLVQEVKGACREAGYRPAARCNAANEASRRTLEKAGLLPCARLLTGSVRADRL